MKSQNRLLGRTGESLLQVTQCGVFSQPSRCFLLTNVLSSKKIDL